jgi:hypothetical protein
MHVNVDLGLQPSSIVNQTVAAAQRRSNEASRTRKITVQLSESTFQRLEAATDRPGLGKSIIVENALERFLDPAPPIEGLLYEALDRITGQMSRLEREIAIIAETVALHARYHLTLTPPMPTSLQPAACSLGHDRFRALAEQVDRRLRVGRSLMRETIDGLHDPSEPRPTIDIDSSYAGAEEQADQQAHRITSEDGRSELSAAAREAGSSRNFRHLPNAFC